MCSAFRVDFLTWCKWKVKVKVAQSCPILCDPIDYTIHGILQARILEWVAFLFSRVSSQPRSPVLQADSLPAEPQGKPKNTGVSSLSLLQQIFPIQELKWGLLHCRQILYQLSYQESPNMVQGWINVLCLNMNIQIFQHQLLKRLVFPTE